MLDKIQDALIEAGAFAVVGAFSALIGVSFTTWLHVRSLRKAMRSAFIKIRHLEKHSYGDATSELDDSRDFDR